MTEGLRNHNGESASADALKDAGQRLLGSLVQRSAEVASQRVDGWTVRLSDITESGGDVRAALRKKSAADDADAAGDGLRGALRGALSGLKERVRSLFGRNGVEEAERINLLEGVEVGLPLRTTYDAWTLFASYPSFNRVESPEQAPRRTTGWTAKLSRSREPGDTTIIEQVPDSRIVWHSVEAQGDVAGAVSFSRLGPDRTQILLVLEWPERLFGRTGRLWSARARRARRDLEYFHRRAMAHVLVYRKEVQGWRGEVRDGELVESHDTTSEQQRTPREGSDEDREAAPVG